MYLNIKTEYNLQESAIKIDKLVKKAQALNLKAIGICEYNSTQSFIKIAEAFANTGIDVTYGIEIVVNEQTYHIYAKNNDGLLMLNQIVTLNNLGMIDDPLTFGTNVIVILGKGKLIDDVLEKREQNLLYQLKKTYRDDLYLGVFSYLNDTNNYKLLNATNLFGLKPVLIDAVKYLDEEQVDTYLTLQAIKHKQKFYHFQELKKKAKRYQMRQEFNPILEDVIKRTNKLLLSTKATPGELEFTYPTYPYTKGLNADEFLKMQIKVGLKWRLKSEIPKIYKERVAYELAVINKMKFSDYFLIVQDIVIFAKKNGIMVGPGRGSAAGSLVAYLLGITEVDPIKYNLYFERFLNPMRKTMPDIDLDFEANRREEVIDYIEERFGLDMVCKIGTVNRFQAKSAFAQVADVWFIDPKLKKIISQQIDSRYSLEKNLETNAKLYELITTDPKLMNIIKIALEIEKIPSSYSIHAAGIIIAPQPLLGFIPQNSEGVSLYEAQELEKMGLLKIDILALDNLTILNQMVKNVRTVDKQFKLATIDYDDVKTYQMLSSGQTLGIFQMESMGMRQVLKQVAPKNFAELATCLALYRPGAKDQLAEYVSGKDNFIATSKIEEILAETNGVLIYQEQVMRLANEMAGYNMAEADLLRRAISKKNPEQLAKITDDFQKRSVKRGYNQSQVTRYLDQILKFAGYGFNKSHAYAYGMITYQMAYIKTNYPNKYYEVMFDRNYSGPNREKFFQELRLQNLKILAPDFRFSGYQVRANENQIILGLKHIKGISKEVAKEILLARREINNINNLEEITKHLIKNPNLNADIIENLIDSGYFDYLTYNHPTLKRNMLETKSGEDNIAKLFGEPLFAKDVVDYDFASKSKRELDVLGININYNLFSEIKKQYQNQVQTPILSIKEAFYQTNLNKENDFITIIKIIKQKEIITKNQKPMAFLTVESDGEFELVCFPGEYAILKNKINNYQDRYVLAQVKIRGDKVYLEKM